MQLKETSGDYTSDQPGTIVQRGQPKNTIDDRFWLQQYNAWLDGKGPKPGRHPNPNHRYNTHPEEFDMDGDD